MTTNKPILKIVSFVYKCSFINKCFSSRKNADTIRNNNEYIRYNIEYYTNIHYKPITTFKANLKNSFKAQFVYIVLFKDLYFMVCSYFINKGFVVEKINETFIYLIYHIKV